MIHFKQYRSLFTLILILNILMISQITSYASETSKTDFIGVNGSTYDSFIIGSNSIEQFDINYLDDLNKSNFYKLNLSQDTTKEYVYDLDQVDSTLSYIINNYNTRDILLTITNKDLLTMKVDPPGNIRSNNILTQDQINTITKSKQIEYMSQTFDSLDDIPLELLLDLNDKNTYKQMENRISRLKTFFLDLDKQCRDQGINLNIVLLADHSNTTMLKHLDQKYLLKTVMAPLYDKAFYSVAIWDYINSPFAYESTYYTHDGKLKSSLYKIISNQLYSPIYCEPTAYYKGQQNQVITLSQELTVFDLYNISSDDSNVTQTMASLNDSLSYLISSGYNTVTLDDIHNYTEYGISLPLNPLFLIFHEVDSNISEPLEALLRDKNMTAIIQTNSNEILNENISAIYIEDKSMVIVDDNNLDLSITKTLGSSHTNMITKGDATSKIGLTSLSIDHSTFNWLSILEVYNNNRIMNKIQIPVLMYHHIVNNMSTAKGLPQTYFENHLKAFEDHGYTAIFIHDIHSYLQGQRQLPKKPWVITFDDGYDSNYKLAYPLLDKYKSKMTIAMIGWSVGRHQFIQEEKAITPHFSWDDGKTMLESGLVNLQNHTFDLHSQPGLSYGYKKASNLGVLQLADESKTAYENRLKEDMDIFESSMKTHLGLIPNLYFYPYGAFSKTSEALLKERGYIGSVAITPGIRTYDSVDDLWLIPRINVRNHYDSDQLMIEIKKYE